MFPSHFIASLVAQVIKRLPALQETQVRSLGQEDPLEKGMATSLVFLPGELHGQRSLAGYSPWGCKELGMTERLTLSYFMVLPLRALTLKLLSLIKTIYLKHI